MAHCWALRFSFQKFGFPVLAKTKTSNRTREDRPRLFLHPIYYAAIHNKGSPCPKVVCGCHQSL